MKRTDVPTQERPLYLLEFFTLAQPAWGLSELAQASGLPKASCLRALRVLETYGLVQRSEQRYRLGARLIALGSLVQESFPPRRVALPHLQTLRDATLQSAQWVVLERLEGVYLEVVESRSRVRLFIAPGRRAPLYAGASTRLLLAFADAEVQNEVFGAKRVRYTGTTPTDAGQLRALLRSSRQTWFAASFGELEAFSAELAAPVFGSKGELVATVSVAGAEAHYRDLATLRGYVAALNTAAERVSRELGFEAPWGGDPAAFMKSIEARVAFLNADAVD